MTQTVDINGNYPSNYHFTVDVCIFGSTSTFSLSFDCMNLLKIIVAVIFSIKILLILLVDKIMKVKVYRQSMSIRHVTSNIDWKPLNEQILLIGFID